MWKHILSLTICLVITCTSVGAESNHWLFVSLLNQRQIVTFSRDDESGKILRVGHTDCPAEPAGMAYLRRTPDLSILFVSYRSSGQLASFRMDPASGELTPINVVQGGDDPAYLLPDRTGRFLLCAYYVSNKVTVHEIAANGLGDLVQTVPTAEKAHGLALDRSNRFLFVPHTGANRIYQFQFRDGRMSPNDPAFVGTPAIDHPRHVTLHPTDRWAYVNNEAGDSLATYEMDDASGVLKRIQLLSTLPEDFDGSRNSTARCEMTPDGRFVYVANRGHDSIACFSIDQASGRLTSLGQVATEKTPRSFTIESRGRFMYVAGQDSGKIATYRIQPNGLLRLLSLTPSGPVSWWVIAVDTPIN